MEISRMLPSIVFYFAVTSTTQALDRNGKNVCRRQKDDKEELFCCYNHHERNNECQECPNGTVSEHGEECESCKEGRFGYLCIQRCFCEEREICDTVRGCVELFDILEPENITGQDSVVTSGHTNIEHTFFFTVKPASTTSTVTDRSSNTILHCIIGIGSSLGFLMICLIVLQIVNKHKKSLTHNINDAEQNSHQDVQFNIYDEIDEISTPVSSHARHSYLSVIDSKSITTETNESISSVSINVDMPVNPYNHTTSKYENQLHKYDTPLALNSKEPSQMEQEHQHSNKDQNGTTSITYDSDDVREVRPVCIVEETGHVSDNDGAQSVGEDEVKNNFVCGIKGTLSVCNDIEYNDGYLIPYQPKIDDNTKSLK